MKLHACFVLLFATHARCRDEERIMKACYWAHEVYDPCFGGCAEISCDNPKNHLRPCYPYCEPGCVCEDPYVRDDRTHQCVMPADCTVTQMGIPVRPAPGTKLKVQRKYQPKPSLPKVARSKNTVDTIANLDFGDLTDDNHVDEYRTGPAEYSRLGNYFNIVIAPPPIKALQPRKMLQSDNYQDTRKKRS